MRSYTGLFLALLFLGLVPSCYCWDKAHLDDPKCKVARQIVDCTKVAAGEQTARGTAIVTNLIATGTFDTPALLAALTNAALSDGECIIAALASDFSTVPRLTSGEGKFLSAYEKWKAKERPGVVYKVAP